VTDCPFTSALPRSATGLRFTYAYYFDHQPEITACNIPAPDIIYDLGTLDENILSGEYTLAYQQNGFLNPSADASAFIVVRREILQKTNLAYPVIVDFNQPAK